MTDNTVTFDAEVKKVSSRKTASLDMEYQVVLVSDDPNVMNLGVYAADVLFKITVKAKS